jgi:hypothetical protein
LNQLASRNTLLTSVAERSLSAKCTQSRGNATEESWREKKKRDMPTKRKKSVDSNSKTAVRQTKSEPMLATKMERDSSNNSLTNTISNKINALKASRKKLSDALQPTIMKMTVMMKKSFHTKNTKN